MCGIVGMAGNLNTLTSKMFRDMLIFDTVRGFDSTGIALVPMQGNAIEVEKDLGAPSNLWEYTTGKLLGDDGVSKAVKKVMIGHNRAATRGKVTVENAHPFTFGHITGVHNGSLYDWKDLEGANELDVDSQAIYNTIALKGIEHTWKSFNGAAALVWWDAKDGTLNIIRNNERPLFIAYTPDESAIFWASEEWMITVAAARNKVELKRSVDAEGKPGKPLVNIPTPDTHYVFKPTSIACPMVSHQVLEKKKFSGATGTNTTAWGNSGSSGYSGYNYNTVWKAKAWKIDTSWAGVLPRADKDVRGQDFKIQSLVQTSKDGNRSFYLGGITTKGIRVELYPISSKEYETWEKKLNEAKPNELWATFSARPRLFETGNYKCYKAATSSIKNIRTKVVKTTTSQPYGSVIPATPPASNVIAMPRPEVVKLYSGFAAKWDEATWKSRVNESEGKGCCSACGDPLTIERHNALTWLSPKVVICEDCSKDQSIRTYYGY